MVEREPPPHSSFEGVNTKDEQQPDSQTNDIVKIDPSKMRKHGLSTWINKYQFLSWAVFVYNFGIFMFFLTPATWYLLPLAIIMLIAYISLTILIVIFGLISILVDPTDPRVSYEVSWRIKGIEPIEDPSYIYFCDVCESFVNQKTKHWGDWNRCWENFDHHCIWLNNCVGKK